MKRGPVSHSRNLARIGFTPAGVKSRPSGRFLPDWTGWLSGWPVFFGFWFGVCFGLGVGALLASQWATAVAIGMVCAVVMGLSFSLRRSPVLACRPWLHSTTGGFASCVKNWCVRSNNRAGAGP